LGAIRRQADQFNIFSRPERGTAVAARVLDEPQVPVNRKVEIGAVAKPYPGERVSGDAWGFEVKGRHPALFVADGSGHGLLAEKAAAAAQRVFQDNRDGDPVAMMQDMHRALAPTRGAAVALALFDVDVRVVRYVGVGNISGAVISPDANVRRMVSHNGTVGHIASRITEFRYPCPPGSLVVLHSDGLSAKWDFQAYPGLAAAHPALVAGVLYRDFRRANDDATVVAMRVPR
jgi:serine phosphatase RsbU (regulator of sigma subunit)